MLNLEDLREANENLPDYVANYTDREIDRTGKFLCFNPEHGENHPSMSFWKHPKTGMKAHCFACGATYDLADIIGINEGLEDLREKLARIKELYGVEIRMDEAEGIGDSTGNKKSHPGYERESQDSEIDSKRIDLTAQAEQAHLDLSDVMREAIFKARGITPEVIDRFRLGHYSNGLGDLLKDCPGLCAGKSEEFSIILPDYDSMGVCRYLIAESWNNFKFTLAANNGKEPGVEKPKFKYKALSGVKKPVWNSKVLELAEPMIAITEGVYDALSFESAGIPAVAIMGTGVREFFAVFDKFSPESTFLLALDNDNAGKKAQADLKAGLEKRAAVWVEFPLEEIAGQGADVNDAWIKSPDKFKAGINKAWESARKLKNGKAHEDLELEREIAERERVGRELYAQRTPMRFLTGNYLERKKRESIDPIPTGLTKLDGILEGGLIPGLYTLGAVSSLGKTTLALQIADNVAQAGHDVIFFSLEMSAEEITDKSLSKCTALASIDMIGSVRLALSLSDLNFPSRFLRFSPDHLECLENALELYRSYAGRVYIHERSIHERGGNFTTQDIQAGILEHKKHTGRNPGLIVIDYLQIIDSQEKHLTPKESLDKTIHDLRAISAEYGVPVIVISSFNRASYDKESSFSNFNGSGQIEYSSDIVIALKYAKSAQENAELIEKGKSIPIEAQVLKNRKGRKGQTELDFYPRCNFFHERTSYRR